MGELGAISDDRCAIDTGAPEWKGASRCTRRIADTKRLKTKSLAK